MARILLLGSYGTILGRALRDIECGQIAILDSAGLSDEKYVVDDNNKVGPCARANYSNAKDDLGLWQ